MVREYWVPRLVAITVAPGMTAPCASGTAPRIVPDGACAWTEAAVQSTAPSAAPARLRIHEPRNGADMAAPLWNGIAFTSNQATTGAANAGPATSIAAPRSRG